MTVLLYTFYGKNHSCCIIMLLDPIIHHLFFTSAVSFSRFSMIFHDAGNPAGLHTQKAYTHTGTSSPQILMLSAHAYKMAQEKFYSFRKWPP